MSLMFLSKVLLLSLLPSVLALPTGAPPQACGDMTPRHNHKPALANKGFYLLGEVFNGSYIPGKTYQSELVYIYLLSRIIDRIGWAGGV